MTTNKSVKNFHHKIWNTNLFLRFNYHQIASLGLCWEKLSQWDWEVLNLFLWEMEVSRGLKSTAKDFDEGHFNQDKQLPYNNR